MMEIIKCNCGYYKQLNDELCPNCKADYSSGDEYEVLGDQETAYMRWVNLGEKGFNDYMKSMEQPIYMLCPECRFKMLVTETECPRCKTPVRYVGNNTSFLDRLIRIYEVGIKSYLYGAAIVIIFFIVVFIIFSLF